jgi:hypothetical protein
MYSTFILEQFSIESLTLQDTSINGEAALCIANALKENHSVQKLDFSQNKLIDNEINSFVDSMNSFNSTFETLLIESFN